MVAGAETIPKSSTLPAINSFGIYPASQAITAFLSAALIKTVRASDAATVCVTARIKHRAVVFHPRFRLRQDFQQKLVLGQSQSLCPTRNWPSLRIKVLRI